MPKRRQLVATFIGLDLAWSARNPSGGAVIHGNRLVAHSGALGSDEEILDFVRAHISTTDPTIVAVDAPLRVPNETGARACDLALSADWRSFQAGALPANRRRLAFHHGQVRGEALVAALVNQLRFAEAAAVPRQTRSRLVCEVYPHPAMVSLFGLERTLKYKARPGRDYELRWAELARYQTLLRQLRKGDPPLKGTKKLLTGVDVHQLQGRAYKRYEDTLDALTCAYVASYLWTHGPRRARTYGSVREGHILVPVTEAMARRLQDDYP